MAKHTVVKNILQVRKTWVLVGHYHKQRVSDPEQINSNVLLSSDVQNSAKNITSLERLLQELVKMKQYLAYKKCEPRVHIEQRSHTEQELQVDRHYLTCPPETSMTIEVSRAGSLTVIPNQLDKLRKGDGV